MTSHETEKMHVALLNKLLVDSGIECLRIVPESPEASLTEGEVEESGPVEEDEPTVIEVASEEEKIPERFEEEVQEELPEFFPTPSLRRVLPDKERKLEEQNRIDVLPEEFNTDIDPQVIPKIASTSQQSCIEILGDLVGCTMYRTSLAEYWFLDTMSNLLRRAQQDQLDRPTQALLILWYCEWMKEMQHFDAADRQRMLKRFQDNMLAAAGFIADEDRIPTPAEAGVFYKAQDNTDLVRSSKMTETKSPVTFGVAAYECALVDFTKIIHYIYDLFSTDYQYDLIRSVFAHTPDHIIIDAPYQIRNPKKLYIPMKDKTKAKLDSAKKVAPPPKGKKREVETQEYLRLMEFKAKEDRYLEEKEEMQREIWNRKNHILPLSMSANEVIFNRYWPQPPSPSEHVVKPETDAKGKGKGKSKRKAK